MSHEVERRAFSSEVEIRAKKDGGKMIQGYALKFNSLSEDLGGFREKIDPQAPARALRENQDVLCRGEHSSMMLLGRCSSGTLRLSLDDVGLRYECDVPDTQAGRDILTLAERRDLKNSSFAFSIPTRDGQSWAVDSDGMPIRTLLDFDLIDVAPVASPAYLATTVSARSKDEAHKLVMERIKETVMLKPTLKEALERGMFRRSEKRDRSFEEKLDMIWDALCALLGSPWDPQTYELEWCVEATFQDRVIVEVDDIYWSYPLTFDADGKPVFGEPSKVQIVYAPVVDASGSSSIDDASLMSVNEAQQKLAEAL